MHQKPTEHPKTGKVEKTEGVPSKSWKCTENLRRRKRREEGGGRWVIRAHPGKGGDLGAVGVVVIDLLHSPDNLYVLSILKLETRNVYVEVVVRPKIVLLGRMVSDKE
jgi:hypothetical protein